MPIFKKGDINDPNNYRAINFVSNLGKQFTNILNQRLLLWSLNNDISDVCFKCYYYKKKLYCAFIDFITAFDYIDHIRLWYKHTVGDKGNCYLLSNKDCWTKHISLLTVRYLHRQNVFITNI